MCELARLLAPRNRMAVSVPFAGRPVTEHKRADVYERGPRPGQQSQLSSRRYPFRTLWDRLIEPTVLELVTEQYVAEPGRQFLF